jgi:hypothetical protein
MEIPRWAMDEEERADVQKKEKESMNTGKGLQLALV